GNRAAGPGETEHGADERHLRGLRESELREALDALAHLVLGVAVGDADDLVQELAQRSVRNRRLLATRARDVERKTARGHPDLARDAHQLGDEPRFSDAVLALDEQRLPFATSDASENLLDA